MKLRALLKRKSEGYTPKKATAFTAEQLKTFLDDAPDEIFLLTKVALIMGVMGACRKIELYSMKVTDFQDLGSALIVTIPETKTSITRRFTVIGKLYQMFKKYASLRPSDIEHSIFFLNYQKCQCTKQRIGMNKFSNMGKQIASFLKLPDPGSYTGHCFRRSSATILIDAGGDITALKRHGGWKSTAVAEGYIDDSIKNKVDTATKIIQSIDQNEPSTSNLNITNNENNLNTINQVPLVARSAQVMNENKNSLDINTFCPAQFHNCTINTLNIKYYQMCNEEK